MKKDLILQVKEITGSKDGRDYSFEGYYVIVNGIELSLKPADNTVKQVLKNYYEVSE
jgi:predicted RNA-binding protein with TRAM domain